MSENEKMFRYLLKYVGKYRVLTELTTDTQDFVRDYDGEIHSDYDELYIPCNYDGKIKHTYSDSILAYFTDRSSTYKRVIKELTNSNIKFNTDEIGVEFIIYFSDSDMPKVAKIVGAKTSGKKIHPFDDVNIPDRVVPKNTKVAPSATIGYSIPARDKGLYYAAMSSIKDRKIKNEFKKNVTEKFIKTLNDSDFTRKCENMQMKPIEYIHYIGKWDNYISYIKENIKC